MSYGTLLQVRNEGLPVSVADDNRVNALLAMWSDFVDAATGQWFESRSATFELDGRGVTLLRLPVPVITVSALYVNNNFDVAVDADAYRVYNGRGGTEGRDDRRNPRIKIVTAEDSIFAGTGQVARRNLVFEVGERNQRVVGTFGYTEPDGSTPDLIEYAVRKMVLKGAQPMYTSGATSGTGAGPVVEEETDRHRKKWADPLVSSKRWTTTGDQEVDQILAMFRKPKFVGGPRTLHRRNRASST